MLENQKKVYDSIAEATGLRTQFDQIQVEQTPTYLKEPMQVADFAAAVVAGFGANVVELGVARGLPAQEVAVDRRHATLTLNNAGYHYMNGVLIRGGEIQVPVNGIYETRDGKWLCFNGAFPHLRDGILKYFDAPHEQDRLITEIAKHDSAKILEDFEKLGLCAAPMFTCEEWLQHPQGQALKDQPVVSLERHGDVKRRILPEAKYRPMEGVRVIGVTHVVAGPWLTRCLADQGADVISVRNPNFPFLYPIVFEESYGKKQITLNLRAKSGKEKARFVELLKDADVLVWGFGPGSLDRLGLDQATLQKLNPNLVVTFLSCYGPKGPWAKRKGWEQLAQTCCGAAELASRGRDQKHIIGALPTDYGSGYLGAAGTMAALRQRQEQGGFWVVNAVLCRTAMEFLALPHEAEDAVPVAIEEMDKYLVDQIAPYSTVFTRIAPAARLSKTPSYSERGPAPIGAHDPFLTGWDTEVKTDCVPKHRPSEILKRGILGFVAGYGHEDIMLRKEPKG